MPNDIDVDKKVFELEVLGEGRFEVAAGKIGPGALFRYADGIDVRAGMLISSLVLRPPITADEIPTALEYRPSLPPIPPNASPPRRSGLAILAWDDTSRTTDSERPTASVSVTLIENDQRVKIEPLDKLFVKTGTLTCVFSVSDVADKFEDLMESQNGCRAMYGV
ncbi:hypothetical protein FA15DRAFT_661719 [Coprinopsis marcescibilis]|uniref:Uncharacterized protein n=1 Tax=Coprinopsis marcescibilis TaxID=230819 RepID=A0A5C3KB45_COPMA|nr:hypothetical protein FA15DRAFT_661719 [Coprinopsis marcescibilis]